MAHSPRRRAIGWRRSSPTRRCARAARCRADSELARAGARARQRRTRKLASAARSCDTVNMPEGWPPTRDTAVRGACCARRRGQARPRLPGGPGRRQRRRDVQDRRREDVIGRGRRRRSGCRRRHLARARAASSSRGAASSCRTWARRTAPTSTASRSTTELVDGDKILVGSTTILKFTYHDKLDEIFQRRCTSRRCATG